MPTPLSSTRAAVVSAVAGLALVGAAIAVPRWTGEDVRVHWPPLHADWDPRFGLLTLPAIAIGLVLWVLLPRIAGQASWRGLLAYAFAGTWLWTMALAMTEGAEGLARVFERHGEYVHDAQGVDSIATMLRTFVDHIPMDSADHWHTHVAGHPPGALLFFVLLDRLGITDPFWIGVVVVTIGSTAVVAVLVTLKTLGSVRLARRAMPWIVLAPTAVWMGVNGDALFTAVAAWGLALLAIAAVSRRALPAVAAGLLLGLCVYLSYGLVLLGILAVAVPVIARTWRPLPWALAGSSIVAVAFTAAGFAWWRAFPVLHERYYDGIASERAYSYWVWADVAAWTFTVGLVVWASFPRAVRALRDRDVVAQLAAAALLTILVATLSGMSKAEVERIWLPFTIWVVALPALLPDRWHRPALLSQVVLALCVQQMVLTRLVSVMTGERPHVLVVEDDLAVRDVLRRYLEQESYDVTVAADGPTGLAAARDHAPDLIVLDVMLPELSGLEICRQLRENDGSAVPIIMLTALGETDDRIAGLTSGADDYVTKPFSVKELTLRVGSVLRRSQVPVETRPAGLLVDGGLTLNPVAREAIQGGAALALTTREFDLLHFFLSHPHEVFSREDLLRQVWGWEYGDHSTVTVHVKRLRHKIEVEPADPTRIVTVYGLGYRWDPQP